MINLDTSQSKIHALEISEITERITDKGHPEWIASAIFESAQRHDRRIQSVFEFRLLLENLGEKK
tara:strand:+ start:399 stop:593 length:195 start_codon:yes stop_codon:yes gene_type:complete